MSNPRVSIVIVNWKTPVLLAGCLESIDADPRSGDFEVRVVDNASDDGSVEMVRERFPRVLLAVNDRNVGFSRACNQVIPGAAGQYVLLLNPDAVIKDDAVSRMADFLDQHPECGACGPRILNLDGSLQLACRRSFPSPAAAFFRVTYLSRLFPKSPLFARYNLTFENPDETLEVDALSGSCMMVRQSVIKQVGLLDEDIFMFGEDIDWCWRIKQAGHKVIYVPQAVVYHHHGAASRLRPVGATINLHQGMAVFYRKHMAHQYWPPFNWIVYGAIGARALVFAALAALGVPARRSAGAPDAAPMDPPAGKAN